MYYLGFDIGGSSTKAVLVKNKKIIAAKSRTTPASFSALVSLLSRLGNSLAFNIKKSELKGAGFGIAGALDSKREKVLRSPNIKYLDNQPSKKIFAKKFGIPVKIEHDVNCFLLAEKEVGLAKNLKNVFYLTIGTGIGGAFMIDGKIYCGAHGAAGEAGHMVIKFQNPNYKPQNFDLEDLAASKFIKKHFGNHYLEIVEQALKGNKNAKKTLSLVGINLGVGIAGIINILDPEAVILAGGLIKARRFILPGIRVGTKKFVISSEAQKTKILWSKLGDFGGALGAALFFDN